MIIVKTQVEMLNKVGCNFYTCPHCKHEIEFTHYIQTMCKKCSKKIFNIEKLLDDDFDVNKTIYYNDEKI